MAEATYYNPEDDPRDPRQGVIARAFLDVPNIPDTSWSSWFKYTSSGGDPQPTLQARAGAARLQWFALTQQHGWKRPNVIVTAAVYCAINKGILDQFLEALQRTAGPAVVAQAYDAANDGWTKAAIDLASTQYTEAALIADEVKILNAMELGEKIQAAPEKVGDALTWGALGLGVAGGLWLLSGPENPKRKR